jgi:hypothetical protein
MKKFKIIFLLATLFSTQIIAADMSEEEELKIQKSVHQKLLSSANDLANLKMNGWSHDIVNESQVFDLLKTAAQFSDSVFPQTTQLADEVLQYNVEYQFFRKNIVNPTNEHLKKAIANSKFYSLPSGMYGAQEIIQFNGSGELSILALDPEDPLADRIVVKGIWTFLKPLKDDDIVKIAIEHETLEARVRNIEISQVHKTWIEGRLTWVFTKDQEIDPNNISKESIKFYNYNTAEGAL